MKISIILLAIVALVASAVAVKHEICALPHSKDGDGIIGCFAYIPSWSYKADTNECVAFVYGGCGGNANRFFSQHECEEKCKE